MRLLEYNKESGYSLTGDIPPYAILSHTWREEEVTFGDLMDGTGKSKAGYDKIPFCGEQAKRDGLQYFWVDTCCIDISNNTERSEAINSMFRWYRDAAKCYVYLSDVPITTVNSTDRSTPLPWESVFRQSRWFTRGWTLQELIAPTFVEFFSKYREWLGDKKSLERHMCEITGIPAEALQRAPLSQFSVNERLLRAENRQTTCKEDNAYSLLGIPDTPMPFIYGEGAESAFKRLREKIDMSLEGLDRLPSTTDAPFNSYNKQHEPTYLPDTRVDLLREIYDWADGQDERRISLNGLAGTGKSTIARTVACKWYTEGYLGASFFFSRGGGDVGHTGKFVTSIAAQLASSIPTINRFICDAIREHSDITSRPLHDKWQQLVLRPLLKPRGNNYCASYVVVIDALDECGDENIQVILQFLSDARSLERVRLRIFLRSRPEVPIRHRFNQISQVEHRDVVLPSLSTLGGWVPSFSIIRQKEEWFGYYDVKPANILWSQDWSELGEGGALQIVDFGLGRFHRLSDNSAGARATLDTRNLSGNWVSDDVLKGLEYFFNEDQHQLEEDGSRSAPNMGWLGWLFEASLRIRYTHRRLTWHEIDVWWRSKIESLLGSGSLKHPDSIRPTETVVRLLKAFKSLPRVPRGGKRRPGRFSLLALPFILTWATPAATELSVKENVGSSLRPSISSTYGDLHYEIQKFLLELMKPWQHDAETAISSEALLVACFLCTCLTVLLFTVRHRDKFQKYFLAAGILLSAIVGAACSKGVQDFIFRYLFFGVNLSLTLSTLYHVKYSARQNSSVKGWPASQKNSAGREFEHAIGTFGDEKAQTI